MSKLVTIGIPIYKRLEYLPHVLSIVASQDYPNIDLLVSDNGMNGTAVPEIVDRYYRKPYRFRQNPSTVSSTAHFNQLVHNASGEYFVVLADDDEISSNYVSDLVNLLEKHPEASVAMSTQESIDEAANPIGRSADTVPEILSGPDFIRTAWGTHEYGFRSFSTFLARTRQMIATGGYADIWTGSGDEDLLLVKLSLDNFVAFSTRSTYRKRFWESSDGYCLAIQDLARGIREFMRFLDTDSQILDYAASHPAEWTASRGILVDMAWKTYYLRWASIYQKRLPSKEWVLAGFALPFIPSYYKAVASTLTAAFMSAILVQVKRFLPQAYDAYRAVKAGVRRSTW